MKLKKTFYLFLATTSLFGGCISNDSFNMECGSFSVILGDFNSQCCEIKQNYEFSIQDTNRDDNNITTKKIGYDFNLTLKTDSSFNGKIYSVVKNQDINISDVNITNWNDELEKNITLTNLKTISKDAYIYIVIETDDNKKEQNSTDHFAIIPTKYLFDIPSQIKAGENYKIEINATDDDNNIQNYYQTLDGSKDKNSTLIFVHKDGTREDNQTINLNFNPSADRNDFNITNIGKYILELNDTNFASIDSDDTPQSQRTIYSQKEIMVIPYKFKTNIVFHSGDKKLYQGYQNDEFNYSIEANITALNKQGEIVSNFDKNEYSSDVNASILLSLKKYDNIDVNLSYLQIQNNQKTLNSFKISNNQFEINYTIKDSNFTKGQSTNFLLTTFIKKNISTPNSPIDMKLLEVNTTSKVAENDGVNVDDNVTYYYPRIVCNDVITTKKDTNTSLVIAIYDSNQTDAHNRFTNLILVNWYKINDIILLKDKIMRTHCEQDSDKIDINLTYNNNILQIDNNFTPPIRFGVIHLDTPPYLWFSKYSEEYSFSEDSSCVNHYCIDYRFVINKMPFAIGSGQFQGSEVNITQPKERNGIKIYR